MVYTLTPGTPFSPTDEMTQKKKYDVDCCVITVVAYNLAGIVSPCSQPLHTGKEGPGQPSVYTSKYSGNC